MIGDNDSSPWAVLRCLAFFAVFSFAIIAPLYGQHSRESPLAHEREFLSRYPLPNGISKFVEVNVDGLSIRTHYSITGSGPDLLLLHGICDSLHTWEGWVSELRSDFRLIRLDYPPFGLTDSFPDGKYSEERMLRFLDAFLEAVEVSSPSRIAGNSLGGGIAWRYATARPHRVSQLVLIDPAGFIDGKEDLPKAIRWAENGFAASFMRKQMPRTTWKKTVRNLYGPRYTDLSSEAFEREVDRFYHLSTLPGKSSAYVDTFLSVMQLAEADSEEKIAARLSKLSIPVQLQWGEEDPWFPPYSTTDPPGHLPKWIPVLPKAPDIQVFPGVGHMPQAQIPARSAEAARNFLLGAPGQ